MRQRIPYQIADNLEDAPTKEMFHENDCGFVD
jgi:hypothetical protein